MANDEDEEQHDPARSGTPHDAYCKAVLGEPGNAGIVLRERLPAEVVALLAPEPPAPLPGSFVDEHLKPNVSDLLYEVRLASGGPALVYALIEHKSRPDALTPLQLLRYMVRIWVGWTRDHGAGTLPAIIPLVFYHGARRWSVPDSFAGLFGDTAVPLQRYLPDFVYERIDLGAIPDAELSVDPRLAVQLAPLKYIFDADLYDRLAAFVDRLVMLDRVDVVLWMNYIIAARKDFGHSEAERLFRPLAPSLREDIMGTLVQEWLEEGYKRGRAAGEAEGRAAGEAEGRAAGEAEGEARLLTRQLQRRFGVLPEAVVVRIAVADTTMIELWGERVLDAATLDDVFATDAAN